jgi:hypothetical protein
VKDLTLSKVYVPIAALVCSNANFFQNYRVFEQNYGPWHHRWVKLLASICLLSWCVDVKSTDIAVMLSNVAPNRRDHARQRLARF